MYVLRARIFRYGGNYRSFDVIQTEGRSLFDELGGISVLRRITKAFYDKIYEHPWLGKYFETIDRDHIASQQAEFMQGVLGGPQ
ncbi:MAG: hypothetical protein GY811_10925, partial [Myxococcales bacterium]|nr:hypothetical protein [Myxococcales bacterium]